MDWFTVYALFGMPLLVLAFACGLVVHARRESRLYRPAHPARAKEHRRISSGSRFEAEIGYSRAVVTEDGWVLVAGTTGYDYATMTIAPGVAEQCEQAFGNIAAALGQAGGSMDDVVRATFIVPDRADWEPCWPVVRKWFAAARPASTLLHAGLQTDAMRIEIEITARLRKA